MNKIEENNNENESQGNTSNSDSQENLFYKFSGAPQNCSSILKGDNINENGSSVLKPQTGFASKRMKRRSKKQLYEKEREEFIKELNNIIGINKDNNNVFKHVIEKNVDFENFIKENIEKIRKMWKTGLWGYFSNDTEKGSGNILGLYRTLLNDSDYMIFSKQKIINIEGKKERKTCYYIEKNKINK